MLALNFIAYAKKHWGIVLMSALLGALSHLFWDSFTHNGGYFAQLLDPLYSKIKVPWINGSRYPFFYALQQISTGVGLLVVLLYVVFLKPEPGPVTRINWLYWLSFVLIAISTILIRFTIHPSDYEIGNFVVTSVSGIILALVVNGLLNFRNHGEAISMGAGRQTGR